MPGRGQEDCRRLASALQPSEEGEEPFHCLICLELVYKPIVQSCGHIFCFWCVHRAMNSRRQSQCPVCRRPYTHFRRVCEKLHFFLLKAAPEEYSRRAREIEDMEQLSGVFSPRLTESPRNILSPGKVAEAEGDNLPGQGNMILQEQALTDNLHKQASACGVTDTPSIFYRAHENAFREGEWRAVESAAEPTRKEEEDERTLTGNQREGGIECQLNVGGAPCASDSDLSMEDFLCASCDKILYRPVVLSCGQVFCESCLKSSSPLVSCPSCLDPHPTEGSMHVCLELHFYLERAFAAEYLKRKEEVLSQPVAIESQAFLTSDAEKAMSETNDRSEGQCVHGGIGCDGCGMFPIVGDWYHCLDCAEIVGYDLCGNCHREGFAVPGRFNQQHKADHLMQKMRSNFLGASDLFALNLHSAEQLIVDFDDYIDSLM